MSISKETVENTLNIYKEKLEQEDISPITKECYIEMIKHLEKIQNQLKCIEKQKS